MNKFIYGFVSAVISMIIVVATAWLLVYIFASNESKLTHIESSAFRMKDGSVFIFVRDYSRDNLNHLSHFILVVDSELSKPLLQIIPSKIVNSDRFLLGLTDDNEKVVLYSPFYGEYLEYSIKEKEFKLLEIKGNMNGNMKILIDSQKVQE